MSLMTCWQCSTYVQDLPKEVDEGGHTNDIVKESAEGMDVITHDAGDVDARGPEELTMSSMPAISTIGKLVANVDDDDFVDMTPIAKSHRRKAPPLLSPYTQISLADMSYTDNDIDETSIMYYTQLDIINKGDRETISAYIG